jgi:hypothetical protein
VGGRDCSRNLSSIAIASRDQRSVARDCAIVVRLSSISCRRSDRHSWSDEGRSSSLRTAPKLRLFIVDKSDRGETKVSQCQSVGEPLDGRIFVSGPAQYRCLPRLADIVRLKSLLQVLEPLAFDGRFGGVGVTASSDFAARFGGDPASALANSRRSHRRRHWHNRRQLTCSKDRRTDHRSEWYTVLPPYGEMRSPSLIKFTPAQAKDDARVRRR